MARAAESVAAPELQTLFDSDWSSGKYRRPKCSKSDFYAGWLTAYERFKIVAPADKVTVVEIAPAAAAAVKPTRKTKPAKATVKDATGIVDQYQDVCYGQWRRACTHEGTSSERNGHLDTCIHYEYDYSSGKAKRLERPMIYGPTRPGEVLHAMKSTCQEEPHNHLVTVYQGGLPLKRQVPKGPAPMDGTRWKQAIPDSLIRKLAIMAGRPEIAP